jgi:GNAT superfamily N-acetyltransferase
MNIRIASSDQDLLSLAPVLLQLRPQYNTASLISQIKKQQPDGYQVAIVEMDNTVACVAGFVMNEKLAWGKCLYVDDLVTSETMRSRGAGKAMIDWLKHYAREQGCRELHLDSGMHRIDAHRFYDREGFDRSSLHFSITDLSE